jgi:hypothetical protein
VECGLEPPDGQRLRRKLVGILVAQLVVPVLQLGPDEKLIRAVKQRIADIPAELRLGQYPGFDLRSEFVIAALDVLRMAFEAELLAAGIDRVSPTDIEDKGIILLRRTAAAHSLTGVDIGQEIRIEEGKSGNIP